MGGNGMKETKEWGFGGEDDKREVRALAIL